MDPATKHDLWQRTVGAYQSTARLPQLVKLSRPYAEFLWGCEYLPKLLSLEISCRKSALLTPAKGLLHPGMQNAAPESLGEFLLRFHEAAMIQKGLSKCQPLERCNGERKPAAYSCMWSLPSRVTGVTGETAFQNRCKPVQTGENRCKPVQTSVNRCIKPV